MVPATPIVDCVGLQIFANELHKPVALAVIKRVGMRLGCISDLTQIRSLDREGVGRFPHLIDVVHPILPRSSLQGGVSFFRVQCYGRFARAPAARQ